MIRILKKVYIMKKMIQKLIDFKIQKIKPKISDISDHLEIFIKKKITHSTNDILLFDL